MSLLDVTGELGPKSGTTSQVAYRTKSQSLWSGSTVVERIRRHKSTCKFRLALKAPEGRKTIDHLPSIQDPIPIQSQPENDTSRKTLPAPSS